MDLATEVIIGLMVVGNLILLGLGYVSWRLIFGTPRPTAPVYQQSTQAAASPDVGWEAQAAGGPQAYGESDPLAGLFRYDSWHGDDSDVDDARFGDSGGVR